MFFTEVETGPHTTLCSIPSSFNNSLLTSGDHLLEFGESNFVPFLSAAELFWVVFARVFVSRCNKCFVLFFLFFSTCPVLQQKDAVWRFWMPGCASTDLRYKGGLWYTPLVVSVFNFIGLATGLHGAKEWTERKKRDRLGKTEAPGDTKRNHNSSNMIAIITIITLLQHQN